MTGAVGLNEVANVMIGERGAVYVVSVVPRCGPWQPRKIRQAVSNYLINMKDGKPRYCLICYSRLREINTEAFVLFNAAIDDPRGCSVAGLCPKCAVRGSNEELVAAMADNISPGQKLRLIPAAVIPRQIGHA